MYNKVVEYIIKHKKINKILSNDSYLIWLKEFTDKYPRFCENSFYLSNKISDSDKIKVHEIKTLFLAIKRYAKNRKIESSDDNNINYYNLKFDNMGYQIGVFYDHGIVFCCNKVKIDEPQKFINFNDIVNTNKALDLSDFVKMLLITLASTSKSDQKVAYLPTNYKQIIQNIICADNDWKDEFSLLIDMDEYFEDHFSWELNLSIALKESLEELKKTVKYNFEKDALEINFTKTELDLMMKKYDDKSVINVMNHFASLLVSKIYTREFQEDFYDYNAISVLKMKELNAYMYEDNSLESIETIDKPKIKMFNFKKKA